MNAAALFWCRASTAGTRDAWQAGGSLLAAARAAGFYGLWQIGLWPSAWNIGTIRFAIKFRIVQCASFINIVRISLEIRAWTSGFRLNLLFNPPGLMIPHLKIKISTHFIPCMSWDRWKIFSALTMRCMSCWRQLFKKLQIWPPHN
jgi:hypothetical protein